MKSKGSTAAVVVSWNGASCISKCLEPLVRSDEIKHIFVVDNASDDRTEEVVNSFDKVIWLPQKQNLGFGQANNVALSYILQHREEYENILLINQDAWIQPTELAKLLENLNESNYDLLSPMHYTENGKNIDGKFLHHLIQPECYPYLQDCITHSPHAKVYSAGKLNAAIWLLPVTTLSNFGFFDPLFFHYGEDIEYCFRLENLGGKLGFCPEVKAIHARISTAQESTRKTQKRQRMINHGYSASMIELRSPFCSFPLACLHASRICLSTALHRLQESSLSQKIDFIYILAGGVKCLLQLPVILKHRSIVRKKGPHFIHETTYQDHVTFTGSQ